MNYVFPGRFVSPGWGLRIVTIIIIIIFVNCYGILIFQKSWYSRPSHVCPHTVWPVKDPVHICPVSLSAMIWWWLLFILIFICGVMYLTKELRINL